MRRAATRSSQPAARRLQSAVCSSRQRRPASGSRRFPVSRSPSPVRSREAGETGGGGREARVGARSARGRLSLPISLVGAGSPSHSRECREAGIGRRGSVRPSGAALLIFPSPATCLPQPVSRNLSPVTRPPVHLREAGEAGDGGRETRVGARSARGRLSLPISLVGAGSPSHNRRLFPVSRNLSPATRLPSTPAKRVRLAAQGQVQRPASARQVWSARWAAVKALSAAMVQTAGASRSSRRPAPSTTTRSGRVMSPTRQETPRASARARV